MGYMQAMLRVQSYPGLLERERGPCYTIESFQALDKGRKSVASSNFDELTKALATSTSRRQTIKVLCNDMQYQTLVAIEGPKNGFYILNGMDHDHDPSFNGTGAGEDLLNEKCS
jgi:hypothetical protein